jgi:hypothetical protein
VIAMARWTLRCDNCNFEFTHSMIAQTSALNFLSRRNQNSQRTALNWNARTAEAKIPTNGTNSLTCLIEACANLIRPKEHRY